MLGVEWKGACFSRFYFWFILLLLVHTITSFFKTKVSSDFIKHWIVAMVSQYRKIFKLNTTKTKQVKKVINETNPRTQQTKGKDVSNQFLTETKKNHASSSGKIIIFY